MRYVKFIFLALSCAFVTNSYSNDEFTFARRAMLDEIKKDTRLTSFVTGKSKLSENVINALLNVPRHKFVRHGD
ncbi:MAG: hypothetical protein OEX07_07065, partial [Gammaproteobacteria bacterium]|nr:hypothetical protein [Gammaproteobacteria bacterium]